MQKTASIAAAVALTLGAFSLQPALADCSDMTGSANNKDHTGIAKDGTHAPLEGSAGSQVQTQSPTGTTTTSAQAAAKSPEKDGANMPMGESSNLATSNQDVAAQQKGGKTAAAVANQGKCN